MPLRAAGIPIPEGRALLGEVRNLSSLIPMAQHSNVAVFELAGTQARGAQFTRARDTYSLFVKIANGITDRIEVG